MIVSNCDNCNCAFIDYLKMDVAISDTSFVVSKDTVGLNQSVTLTPAFVTCTQAWTVNGGTTGLAATTGTTTFTPPAVGSYTICNSIGEDMCEGLNCKTIVSIIPEIIAVNDLITIGENEMTIINVLPNDTVKYSEIDTAGMQIYTQPVSGGTATFNPNGTINYTPPLDFSGMDTLEYIVCDVTPSPNTICDTAMVVITVVNDPCAPSSIANITTSGGSSSKTSIDLSADPAAIGFTGTWSISSGMTGGESFSAANNENTTVSNLSSGVTYTFRWTVSCDADGAVTNFEEVTFCVLSLDGMILMRQ